MNKFLVLAFTLIISSTSAFAQVSREEMNKEYAEKYKEVGTDPTLSGYEKGQKKRELGLKQKRDNIEYNNDHSNHHHDSDLKDRKKGEIEKKIDRLEDKYNKDKNKIENNNNLSKKEKKAYKKTLEKKYKAEKEILKKKKDAIK